MLKSLDDDSHVRTRICRLKLSRMVGLLKLPNNLLRVKLKGKNIVLKKYGLKTDTSVKLKALVRYYL